jgi:hypothetical protein
MSKRNRIDELGEQATQTLAQVYVRSPKRMRGLVKPLVKTAIHTERKFKPYVETSKVKADMWIETNIKGNRAVRIGSAIVKPLTSKKKPTPQKKKKSMFESIISVF